MILNKKRIMIWKIFDFTNLLHILFIHYVECCQLIFLIFFNIFLSQLSEEELESAPTVFVAEGEGVNVLVGFGVKVCVAVGEGVSVDVGVLVGGKT